ncbi:cytochrome B6 [Sulfobacillus harzensis]|uniref:Cytochrome B6 n=1 Tax=Sulfobacillus harzensis TaxID=2729629 RepID=A0A7Y0L7N3_9FIRM|nr:cytochrome B6 [Sulfobacillus harzensis]NMP24822.1 cytochrome B6 [Sulfobacillus harzensis]
MSIKLHDDVVKNYRMVPEDFVKHLFTTLGIVIAAVLLASIFFGVPEKQPLTIQHYAQTNPIGFEQVALNALDGKGRIANYGPPYNNGTGNVESPIQKAVGVLHPVNTAQDFILKPLSMAATVNPGFGPTLNAFESASAKTQSTWETNYNTALAKAHVVNGKVVVPSGNYGPVPQLMSEGLALGKSGLYSGALIRNPKVVTRFDNQNYLLFLQGAPLHQAATPLQLLGEQWGIAHPAVAGYPAAWWMTIPTWIYQWGFVANSPAADAVALAIGFLFWLALALTPWIPGWNKLPRYLGVHKLIWKNFYNREPADTPPALTVKGDEQNAF